MRKKWLSYRETAVLGCPLKAEEVREFMHSARQIRRAGRELRASHRFNKVQLGAGVLQPNKPFVHMLLACLF